MQASGKAVRIGPRGLTVLVFFSAALSLCNPASALEPGEFLFEWEDGRCSLEAREARMTDVLADIEATTGIPIHYDETDPATTTQSIKDADLERLMRILAENVVLTYVKDPTQPEGYRVESVEIDASAEHGVRAPVRAQPPASPPAPPARPSGTPVKYSGVGARIQFTPDRQGIRFHPIVDNAPVTRAGIAPHDAVVAVEGEPVSSFGSLAALSKAIRGPVGTPVNLTVRSPDGTIRERQVVRETVDYRSGRRRP